MNQPRNYENVQASGDYTPVELGGHYLIIKQVSETKSKAGADMIVVLFDFDQNDAQAGYFTESFKNDVRPDKKWPNQATKYVMVNDSQTGETGRSFKTFCTCVENSNAGFETKWGDNWGTQFKGKKIGGVFGEELDFYNGKERTKRVLRWFVSVDKVADARIPDVSETKAYKDNKSVNAAIENGDFMNIPEGDLEELPFA